MFGILTKFRINKNRMILGCLGTVSLSLFLSCTGNEPDRFHINGFIEGATDRILLVKEFDGEGYQLLDSVRVRNGEFSYSGKLQYPKLYRFYLANSEEYFPVFVENQKIYINTTLRNFRKPNIRGSASHALYENFVNHIDSINQAAMPLLKALKKKGLTDTEKEAIKRQLDSLASQQIEYIKTFVRHHRQSVVSLYILYKYLSNELPVDEYERLYRQMDTTLFISPYAAFIDQQIEIMKHTRVGQKAYDLILPDTTGTSIALQSIHNPYILLHFWASWCDACRNEIPDVVALHQKHKDRLTIVGISLDTSYKRWKEAINQFRMNWIHLSDLKGWKNKGAAIFGVRAIPYYILLDKNHTILYKGSRLEDVKKLINNGS